MKYLGCLISIFFFILSLGVLSAKEDGLMGVVSIMRHGDRSPTTTYPLAANSEENFEPTGFLTRQGQKQHWDRGVYLKKKYTQEYPLLPESYNPYEVYMQSTFLNRTYNGAIYQLRGMYPAPGATFNSYHSEEEFPYWIVRVAELEDRIGRVMQACLQYVFAILDLQGSDDYLYIVDYFLDNYGEKLEELTGQQVEEAIDMVNICEYLYWANIEGLELSIEVTEADRDYCNATIDQVYYLYAYGTVAVNQLSSWEFAQVFKEFGAAYLNDAPVSSMPVFQKYYQKVYGTDLGELAPPKMAQYIAHSYVLQRLMTMYGFPQYPRPPTAATINFEYHLREGALFVKTFYQDDVASEPFLWKIPGQEDDLLEFGEFKRHLDEVFSNVDWTDMDSECLAPYESTGVYYSGHKFVHDVAELYDLVMPEDLQLE